MTTVTIETHYLRCPKCSHLIHKGRRPRNFGPGYLRCRECGEVFDSTLDEWAGLFPIEKILAAAGEIFFPSSMEKMNPNVFILLLFILPILLLISPFLLIWSLIRCGRMIAESNRFTRTRQPPAW
jgi:hypothetical protein